MNISSTSGASLADGSAKRNPLDVSKPRPLSHRCATPIPEIDKQNDSIRLDDCANAVKPVSEALDVPVVRLRDVVNEEHAITGATERNATLPVVFITNIVPYLDLSKSLTANVAPFEDLISELNVS